MKKAIAVLLIMIMTLSLVACAKKGDASVEAVAGTWRVNTQATLDGLASTSKTDFESMVNDSGYAMEVTLNRDGTASMTVALNGQSTTAGFTYRLENGIMIMEFETETNKFHYKVDGDRMIFVRNGSDLVLDRK